MAAQDSMLDYSEDCHPKPRRDWKVYGLVVVLVAVVLLAAALPSYLCLVATKPEQETGLGMGTGGVPGLEGLAWLLGMQQQLRVQVAALEQALVATNQTLTTMVDITNRSIVEMLKKWDDCRSQLDTMQKFVVELGQQISQLQQHKEKQEAVVKQLQEDNRVLQEEGAQQKEQLDEVQRHRSSFQEQIQEQIHRLSAQIWDIRNSSSSGSTAMPSGSAMALSLLVTLLTAKWLH
nr:reconstituted bone marrow stromal antigen 2 [synthetic construct]